MKIRLNFTINGRPFTTEQFQKLPRYQQAEVLERLENHQLALYNTIERFRRMHTLSDPLAELTDKQVEEAVKLGFDPLYYVPGSWKEARARWTKINTMFKGEPPLHEIKIYYNYLTIRKVKKDFSWDAVVKKEIEEMVK